MSEADTSSASQNQAAGSSSQSEVPRSSKGVRLALCGRHFGSEAVEFAQMLVSVSSRVEPGKSFEAVTSRSVQHCIDVALILCA